LYGPIFLIEDLIALSKFTSNSTVLQPFDNEILQYLCEHPSTSAYEIYTKEALGKGIDYRKIRRHINELSAKGLINIFQTKTSEHKAKYCKLSIGGIYCLILKNSILPDKITKGILRNYGDNILFQLFLYPYINQDTLLQIRDTALLSRISLFLYECCKEIEYALGLINNSRSRYSVEQVFIWQYVPAKDYDTNNLREFLKRTFNLDWVHRAGIEKIENDNSLRISYKANSILITLNDTRTKAILKINRKNKYEFIVKAYHHEWYSIEAPVMPIEEYVTHSLLLGTQQRVPALIFNLASNAVSGSSYFQILSQDEQFIQSLEKTNTKFNVKSNEILKRQKQ
jgi:hypothetical protein